MKKKSVEPKNNGLTMKQMMGYFKKSKFLSFGLGISGNISNKWMGLDKTKP